MTKFLGLICLLLIWFPDSTNESWATGKHGLEISSEKNRIICTKTVDYDEYWLPEKTELNTTFEANDEIPD